MCSVFFQKEFWRGIRGKLVEFWLTFLKYLAFGNSHFVDSGVWAEGSFYDMPKKNCFIGPHAGTDVFKTAVYSLWCGEY